MIAFLLIPGICGIMSFDVLEIKRRPLARDILFYGAALAMLAIFFSGILFFENSDFLKSKRFVEWS